MKKKEIKLDKETFKTIELLAKEQKDTNEIAFKKMVATALFFYQVVKENGSILIETKNKSILEVNLK